MKKTLLAAFTIIALSIPSFAGVAVRSNKKIVTPTTPECFKAGEIQLDVFGIYTDGRSNRGADGFGGGLGLGYFITRNFGVDVEGNIYASDARRHSDTVENINANLIYRFPMELGGHCLAPYIFGGGGYVWDGGNGGEGHAGLGIEYRVSQKIGIFADGRHAFAHDFTNARFGVRFVF